MNVQICTASDDAIRVDINETTVTTVETCRGSKTYCQESNPATLKPGMNKITAHVWQGDGGYYMRVAIKDVSGNMLRSDDTASHRDTPDGLSRLASKRTTFLKKVAD